MSANSLMNDPERFSLANELHARPFPELTAPCRAIHLSIRPRLAEKRDKAEDKALLIRLIDRFGGAHPHRMQPITPLISGGCISAGRRIRNLSPIRSS